MMARGSINHLSLTVSDLERSTAFYDKVFAFIGFTRVGRFIGVEDSSGIAGLNKDGEVDVGIAEHFEQNVFWGGLTYNTHPISVAAALATIS
jgi:catechol 2,3-dioxygenase-like lactoylglutathione lyase family enzyme